MRAAAAAALAACLAVARAQPKNTYDGKYKPGWNGEAKTPPVCSPPHPSSYCRCHRRPCCPRPRREGYGDNSRATWCRWRDCAAILNSEFCKCIGIFGTVQQNCNIPGPA